MRVVLVLIAASIALGACAKPKAAVVAEPTVLQVPSPPPRVIVPPEPPDDDQDPGFDVVDKGDPKPRPRPAPPKAAAPPKPGETAPPAVEEPAKQSPPTSATPATLQLQLATSPKEVENRVNDQIKRAKAGLDNVDYTRLSADAKAQYDMALRFLDQARQALVEKNFVFAGKLAEKAGNIATVLLGR